MLRPFGVIPTLLGRQALHAVVGTPRRRPPVQQGAHERHLETLIRRIMHTLVRSGAVVVETHDDGTQSYLALDEKGEDALTQLQGRDKAN